MNGDQKQTPMAEEEILRICKRIDSTAWAFDAEPDAYLERRQKSLDAALKEWRAKNGG